MKIFYQTAALAAMTVTGVLGGSTIVEAVGLVTTQGDIAMKSDIARRKFGVDGTGITIGVLSDSFNNRDGAATDIATGDLPSNVNVLKDLPRGGTDEGRAMLQIIHDVAPGSNLAFHTGFLGLEDFANGIERLAYEAGAKIIIDDIYDDVESMFQDSIVAQTIDKVVASGVTYFSSSGNYGRKAYESAFSPSGIRDSRFTGELHDFDPGSGIDTFQNVSVPRGSELRISFQWDSPFFSTSPESGGFNNDLDIFLLDNTLTNVLASSTNKNVGADPVEVLSFINDGSLETDRFNLAISKSSGSDPELMKYVVFGFVPTINEFDTASPSLFGHANAKSGMAVGASLYANTPEFGTDPATIQPFSAPGTTPILFDTLGNRLANPEIRQKPEIVAPDGVNTTFFGQTDIERDGYRNFLGTSAAAPHAAAVAALMLQSAPNLDPNTIYSILQNTALDMDDPSTPGFDTGFDFATGYGFIQADRAVAAAKKLVPEPSCSFAVLLFGVLSASSFLKKQIKTKKLRLQSKYSALR